MRARLQHNTRAVGRAAKKVGAWHICWSANKGALPLGNEGERCLEQGRGTWKEAAKEMHESEPCSHPACSTHCCAQCRLPWDFCVLGCSSPSSPQHTLASFSVVLWLRSRGFFCVRKLCSGPHLRPKWQLLPAFKLHQFNWWVSTWIC